MNNMVDTERNGNPIAIFCGGMNLSLDPPRLRRDEPDWLAAMARPMDEIRKIAKQLNDIPIFCNGGIFANWKAEPELISFAMEHISFMYTIPGKNDIPFGDMDFIEKSAFHTLEKIGAIYNISKYLAFNNGNYMAVNFPNEEEDYFLGVEGITSVALINDYEWEKGLKSSDNSKNPIVNPYNKYLYQFEFSVFGDNNIPLCDTEDDYTVFNCGSFMRREINEVNHSPRICILTDQHKIISHELDSNAYDILSP